MQTKFLWTYKLTLLFCLIACVVMANPNESAGMYEEQFEVPCRLPPLPLQTTEALALSENQQLLLRIGLAKSQALWAVEHMWHCSACEQTGWPLLKFHQDESWRLDPPYFGFIRRTCRACGLKTIQGWKADEGELTWQPCETIQHKNAVEPDEETFCGSIINAWLRSMCELREWGALKAIPLQVPEKEPELRLVNPKRVGANPGKAAGLHGRSKPARPLYLKAAK